MLGRLTRALARRGKLRSPRSPHFGAVRLALLVLVPVLFAAGFLAACGGSDHAIKPGETIKLHHPVTIDGHTVTYVVISPTVRTTQ